jgi:hypothetical protein
MDSLKGFRRDLDGLSKGDSYGDLMGFSEVDSDGDLPGLHAFT